MPAGTAPVDLYAQQRAGAPTRKCGKAHSYLGEPNQGRIRRAILHRLRRVAIRGRHYTTATFVRDPLDAPNLLVGDGVLPRPGHDAGDRHLLTGA